MKTISAGKAGILSAILASVCCIGPLLLVAVGLGSGAAFLGRYHWLFFGAGVGVLTWSWIKFVREKRACDCEGKPMASRNAGLFMLLAATAIVLGFGALNISRYLRPAPAEASAQPLAGLARATIPVEGMTCATCEFAVNTALRRVDGVKSADASAAAKSVVVDYDGEKTSVPRLVEAINATGYHATLPGKEGR
jgi:mercuric ion transport protein